MPDGLINGQQHEFPHCNSEVLHAPGECVYCDAFPKRQADWTADGTPFTPNESNGWSGNVAVKAGEQHTHMGATFTAPTHMTRDEERSWLDNALYRLGIRNQ